ncbi:uncharacterized protein LOC126988687 isoform X1 [Eriocheir sinensis]|uniref:uncharacterized protein LOC126988687 isoform X1 n=1 Tax=Eriocheir sinensis TaxID=95602 RepID=UPI0021CA10AD|nr:uncharacterized protein LOC126988687 isoform X1 [Eriocheir sinensis]
MPAAPRTGERNPSSAHCQHIITRLSAHHHHTVSTSPPDCRHIITTLSARHHQTVGTSSPHCQHITTRLSAHHQHTVSTSPPDCHHVVTLVNILPVRVKVKTGWADYCCCPADLPSGLVRELRQVHTRPQPGVACYGEMYCTHALIWGNQENHHHLPAGISSHKEKGKFECEKI